MHSEISSFLIGKFSTKLFLPKNSINRSQDTASSDYFLNNQSTVVEIPTSQYTLGVMDYFLNGERAAAGADIIKRAEIVWRHF
jgi:hypothetical protein